jgi:uncharacterized protein (DUF736 family)
LSQQKGEDIAMDDKSNLGALFLNDKRGNEKAPDYRGQLTTDSSKYSIAGWRNSGGKNHSEAGRGILFNNPKKATDKHPDMMGSITSPKGIRYFISAWHRESLNGNKYLRLAIKEWANEFDVVGSDTLSLACQDWKDK